LFAARDTSLSIIKVSDFGLARFIDNETLATTTCGTPGYVAPEILEQRPYRDACDFWSVGVVLFILLSGTPPFYDEDNFALFEKIKRCDYNFNAPSWQSISSGAKDLISKLLVADPEARLTGEQIMSHPWILGQSLSTTTDQNILRKMRDWNSGRIRHVQP
jgi:serine/threonine protein kinase